MPTLPRRGPSRTAREKDPPLAELERYTEKGVSGMAQKTVSVEIDSSILDETIEKANRLLELLQEVSNIIDSLSARKSEP